MRKGIEIDLLQILVIFCLKILNQILVLVLNSSAKMTIWYVLSKLFSKIA